MISIDLAHRLKDAGAQWTPSLGDRFMVPERDLDDEIFSISDMVVEVRDLPTGRLFCFNGTTEWALDSLAQRDALWLPREEQLRAMLGDAFSSMHATPAGFVVAIARDGRTEEHVDADAECAYARAVLSLFAG